MRNEILGVHGHGLNTFNNHVQTTITGLCEKPALGCNLTKLPYIFLLILSKHKWQSRLMEFRLGSQQKGSNSFEQRL